MKSINDDVRIRLEKLMEKLAIYEVECIKVAAWFKDNTKGLNESFKLYTRDFIQEEEDSNANSN